MEIFSMKAYKDNDHETRITILETLADQTHKTLSRLEKKMDDNFEKIEQKLSSTSDRIEKNIDSNHDEIKKIILRLDDKYEIRIENMRKEIVGVRQENTNQFRIVVFTLLTLIGCPLMVEGIQFLNHWITS